MSGSHEIEMYLNRNRSFIPSRVVIDEDGIPATPRRHITSDIDQVVVVLDDVLHNVVDQIERALFLVWRFGEVAIDQRIGKHMA